MDAGRLSLNQITVNSLSLEQAVDACGRHGIGGIALWRDKIAAAGLERSVRLVRDAGLRVTSVCRGGMFTDPAATPAQVLADNRRAVEEAAALGADVLVLVCGPLTDTDLPGARRRVRDGIEALLPHAAAAGVRLGIEPLHPMMISVRSVVVSLRQALDLVEEFDDEHLGVVVDAYHVWWDPDLAAQLVRARGRVLGYHVSDWKPATTDLLLDRVVMGDGLIDLPWLSARVAETGFTGGVEVEVLSSALWREDPDELLVRVRRGFADAV
ncbi:sugar phosphate isomerase/epimerase family protein [Kineococcus rubinsiae]|uniref:sugar phosphate isomerase/epimerase family protein n=1 Tax=Kineococcus rubinsiae TaxID=2609562 RepID=UPI001430E2A3|nr:sugar phosphate isomerase/epimerase family protein [Kineococcus rubinsiae]NIZ92813.1 sugar phosphate isomerase/epimerase [Kineococcus rubinsiae]